MDEQALIERLTTAGYRVTTPRLLVWRALSNAETHPSANEIHQQLVADHPAMGLATVYNTLDLFEKFGIVSAFTVDGVTHYDPGPEPHVNLICERCGQVYDVKNLPIAAWKRDVEEQSGFVVAGRNINLYGICPACQHDAGDDTE